MRRRTNIIILSITTISLFFLHLANIHFVKAQFTLNEYIDTKEILPPLKKDHLEPLNLTSSALIYSDEELIKAASEADTIKGNKDGKVTQSELNAYIAYLDTLPLPNPPTPSECPNCTFQLFLPLVMNSGKKNSPAQFLKDNYSLFTVYRGDKNIIDLKGFRYSDVVLAMRLDLQPGFSEYDKTMGAQVSIHKAPFDPGISLDRAMLPFHDLVELPISQANINDPTMEYLVRYAPTEITSYKNWKDEIASTISWQIKDSTTPSIQSKIIVQLASISWGKPELWRQYSKKILIGDLDFCGQYDPSKQRIDLDNYCTDLDLGYGVLFDGRAVASHDLHSTTYHEFMHYIDDRDGKIDGVISSMSAQDISTLQSKYFLLMDTSSYDIKNPYHQLSSAVSHWFEAPEVYYLITDGDQVLDRYFHFNSRTRTPMR